MVILSIPEISFQHFRGSDENRRHSKGDFGFRLPLPWAEGVPNPGLPFPVRKVPVQAWEPPAATAKNWQVGLSRTEVQLHPCNKSKRLHRTMLSGYSDHNLDKYMRVRMTVLAVLIMMEDQNLSGTSKAVSFSSPETSCWAWQNISTGVWLVSLSNMTWILFPYGHCTALLATLNCVQFIRFVSCGNEIKWNKGSFFDHMFSGLESVAGSVAGVQMTTTDSSSLCHSTLMTYPIIEYSIWTWFKDSFLRRLDKSWSVCWWCKLEKIIFMLTTKIYYVLDWNFVYKMSFTVHTIDINKHRQCVSSHCSLGQSRAEFTTLHTNIQ